MKQNMRPNQYSLRGTCIHLSWRMEPSAYAVLNYINTGQQSFLLGCVGVLLGLRQCELHWPGYLFL